MTAAHNTDTDEADLARAEQWLDELCPETTPAENPTDLRRIGLAHHALDAARAELDQAVAAARGNGRSWGAVGMVLGVSKQAARQRFSDTEHQP